MRLHIRWSKVSIVAIAMAAVLSVAFIAPLVIDQMRDHRAAQLHPHPANDAQQVEILRGVLKEGFFTSWRLPPREGLNKSTAPQILRIERASRTMTP